MSLWLLGLGLCVGTPVHVSKSALTNPTFLDVKYHVAYVGWGNARDVLHNKVEVYTSCDDDGKSPVALRAGQLKDVDLTNSSAGLVIEWFSGVTGQTTTTRSICTSHLFTDSSAATELGCSLVHPGSVYTRERRYPGYEHLTGWVDPHTHMFAQLAFGGRFLFGAATGDISQSLAPCDGSCLVISKIPTHPSPRLFPSNSHGAGMIGEAGDDLILEGILRGTFNLDTHLDKRQGYPTFEHWPRWNDVTHQQMHVDWLRRAHQQGLQLILISAVNSEILCDLLTVLKIDSQTHRGDCADLPNLLEQIDAVHALVSANSDWMGLALSPQDAIQVASQGRLAVVLGIESSDSFGRVPLGSDDEVRQFIAEKVDQFYDKGVRSFQIVHEFNNDFSGAALHAELLRSANKILVARDKWVGAQTSGASHDETPQHSESVQSLLQQIREAASKVSVPSLSVEALLASPVNLAVTLPSLVSGFSAWMNRESPAKPVAARPEMEEVAGGLGQGTVSNRVGLSKAGRMLVEYLFNKPNVILDQAHVSAQAASDLDALAKAHNDYPTFVSHGSLLSPFSPINGGDFTVTQYTIHRVLRTGGFVGLRTEPIHTRPFLFSSVPNDCPGSVKSWIQHLQMLQVFDLPLSLSSDLNGMALNLAPRFGHPDEACAQAWLEAGCKNKNSTTCDLLRAERDKFQAMQGPRENHGTDSAYDIKGLASVEFEGAVLADADQLGMQTRDIRLSVRDFISMWLRASDSNRQPLPLRGQVPSSEEVRAVLECGLGWGTGHSPN